MLKAFSFVAMSHIKCSRLPAMQVPLRALVKSVHSPPHCRVCQVVSDSESLVLAAGPVLSDLECIPALSCSHSGSHMIMGAVLYFLYLIQH